MNDLDYNRYNIGNYNRTFELCINENNKTQRDREYTFHIKDYN